MMKKLLIGWLMLLFPLQVLAATCPEIVWQVENAGGTVQVTYCPTLPTPDDYNYVGTATKITYPTAIIKLTTLCTANPTWQCLDLGLSANGNVIKGVVIAPVGFTRTILIDAAIHGNEQIGSNAAFAWLTYLWKNPMAYPTTRWVIIPVSNPDGMINLSRKNDNVAAGRQVNLNRNHPEGFGINSPYMVVSTIPSNTNYIGPYALSEPEALVFRQVVDNFNPTFYLSLHGVTNAFMAFAGQDDILWDKINAAFALNGYPLITWRVNTLAGSGATINYTRSKGIPSYVYEYSTGDVATEVRRMLIALKVLFKEE
jgi:hypothetical protein